jgi:hypothetical protein
LETCRCKSPLYFAYQEIPYRKKYTLEKDHIFPYAALKANGYNVDDRFKYALAQEVTNRAILTKLENRGKSDTAAKDYLVEAKKQFPSALKKQCIPADESLWEMSRFEEFLSARRSLLATRLNVFLDGITSMESKHGTVSIEDIIAEGEHDGLEFKSSLRWDTNQGKINSDLEKVVLKAVAAFNNGFGDGGKLILGVDDERSVLGLENDYSTLKGNSRDALELHLRNLIATEWGIQYSASNIGVTFYDVGGQDVCMIDIRKGSKPLFVKVTEKSGVKAEKFYARSGNSSPPIVNPSEIAEYISNRFK